MTEKVGAGWFGFERQYSNAISDMIAIIERVGSLDFNLAEYDPSHVVMFMDENTIVEATDGGVQFSLASKYMSGDRERFIACKPLGLTNASIIGMYNLAQQMAKAKIGYDYAGLIGDALEGFTGIDDILPELHKMANPLHDDHKLFCSAAASLWLYKGTEQYQSVKLFHDYTISKISPMMLLQGFPWEATVILKEVEA